MSTVAVCLRDTMWTLDIHTLWYGYIFFVVSGSEALITTSLIASFLSQSFHYCWVFVVSAALGGTRVTGAPQIKTVNYSRRYSQLLSVYCGRGNTYRIAGPCTFDFVWLTFGPRQVFTKFPNPYHLYEGASNDCDPLFSFSLFFFNPPPIVCLYNEGLANTNQLSVDRL